MKNVLITTVLLFSLGPLMAQSKIRWDLQVTDPDFELKNYKLDQKKFKPFLEKTSWRCFAGETERKGNMELKNLSCDYSVEEAGTVATVISCSPERKYSEGFFDLYDERKKLSFKVMLTCRFE